MTEKEYAEYCGPAVVASALEIPRSQAVRLLIENLGWDGRTGGTDEGAISSVLGVREETLVPWFPRKGRKRKHSRWPTVTQFLREHPRGEFILHGPTHVVHVKDGEVVEDNGWGGSRMRVLSLWRLDDAPLYCATH